MRRIWIFFLLSGRLFPLSALSQVSDDELFLLKKLDSIQNSCSVSKYFASLYFNTTTKAVNFFWKSNMQEKLFINRLEIKFADLFLRSVNAYMDKAPIPHEWKTYFADSALSPLQYQLLGINAHINGDIWQALTVEFTLKEIQEGRESYYKFQKGLIQEYKDFYKEAFDSNAKVRLLQSVTMGFDKLYGESRLVRWRKRQIQLAVLYYKNKDKFNNKLKKLGQKKEHIDRMILRNL